MTQVDELQAHQDSLKSYHHTLTEAFRGLDSDVHTALVTARHNITLMNALRITQLAQGSQIAGLVTDVAELKSDMSSVKSGLEEVLRRLQN